MMLKQRKSEAWRRFGYLVLISVDFDDFTSPFTLKFLCRLRRYIKHSRQCFIDWLSKQLELRQKYSAACRIFNSPLGVCISQGNTVSRVWYTTWTLYGAAKFKLSCNFVFHCKAIHVGSFRAKFWCNIVSSGGFHLLTFLNLSNLHKWSSKVFPIM